MMNFVYCAWIFFTSVITLNDTKIPTTIQRSALIIRELHPFNFHGIDVYICVYKMYAPNAKKEIVLYTRMYKITISLGI